MAISTGELNKKLQIEVSVDRLKELGFNPAPRPNGKRVGTFWAEEDVPKIAHGLAAALTLIGEAEQEALDNDDSF